MISKRLLSFLQSCIKKQNNNKNNIRVGSISLGGRIPLAGWRRSRGVCARARAHGHNACSSRARPPHRPSSSAPRAGPGRPRPPGARTARAPLSCRQAPDAGAPSSRAQLRRREPLTPTLPLRAHPPPGPGSGPTGREPAAASPAPSEHRGCGDGRRLRGHGRAGVALGQARGDRSRSSSLGSYQPSRAAAAAAAAGAVRPG